MTVNNTASRATGTGNGVTTAFPFSFKIFAAADVDVYLDGVLKTLTTDYTVTVGPGEAGTVTFVAAPANGVDVVIVRRLPYTQPTGLPSEGKIPERTLEQMVDRAVILSQQLLGRLDRSLTLDEASSFSGSLTVPDPENGKVLGWVDNDFANVDVVGTVLPNAGGNLNRLVKAGASGYTVTSTVTEDASGRLTIAAPVSNTHAATKKYVDDAIAALAVPVFTKQYVSSDTNYTASSTVTFAHGLAAVPKLAVLRAVCVNTDSGYSPGEEISIGGTDTARNSSFDWGHTLRFDSTNVYVAIGPNGLTAVHKTPASGIATLNQSNWRIKVYAYA